MAKQYYSRKSAKIVALIIFLLGLALLTYLGNWWPAVMLVVGIPLAILQWLQGRRYDVYITLFVFIGAFVTVQFNIQWQVILPVLFTLGGIYIFFREYIESRTAVEEEQAPDEDLEIEETPDEDEKKEK
jgi:predicted membrane protein